MSVGAGLRHALERVELPRPQVHAALGPQRRGVEIVGEALRHLAHRRGIRRFARRLVAVVRRGDVALGERVDERALGVAAVRGALLRVRQVRVRLLQAIGRRRVVVVGAEGQRHAPVRHRRFGIERRGALERSKRLFVIEPVEKRQPFVEELLRVGSGA